MPNTKQTKTANKPSLKINALSNWIALGVSIAVGFFLTPAIAIHLGEKRFGLWMLASSIVGYFGLLRFGVGTGVLRYVSLFRGKRNKIKVDAIVSSALAFYTVIGFVIFITSFLCAPLISDFFQAGKEMTALIRLVGLAAALECPSLIFDTTIRSYEGFVYVNMVGTVVAIIRAGALFGCILMGYGLVLMGGALVIVTSLALIAQGITCRIYCADLKLGIRKMSLSMLKLLLLYGLIITVEAGANLLTIQSPKLIVGKIVSLEAVGFFGIVCLLMLYYGHVIFALSKVFMPRFSYLSGQNASEEIRRLFLRGSTYLAVTAGAVALLLWVVGPSFLQVWMKNNNIKQAVPAMMILTAGMLVCFSHRISMDLLYGLGKQKLLAAFAMIEGTSVLGLSLVLSHRYGMAGVAIGVSVPLIFVRGFIQTKYVCRLIEVGFWKYYRDFILKPWIIVITLAVGSGLLGVINFVNNWPSLFLVSGLIMFAYGAAVYITAIGSEDKRRIKDRILAVVMN